MRAFCHLELKHANLNIAVVYEIGEISSVAIMDLSDGRNGSTVGQYGIHLIAFWSICKGSVAMFSVEP
jgi:hypothetical protein